MAKAVKKKKAAPKKATVSVPKKRQIQFCIDFSLFADNTVLGPNFALAGFQFTQAAGGPNMFVNVTAGEQGLQFPSAGMKIKLASPATSVTMRAGTFAGPFNVIASDSSGTQVASRAVNFGNAYGNVTLATTGNPITTLAFTGGGNEGILVQLCIRFVCVSP